MLRVVKSLFIRLYGLYAWATFLILGLATLVVIVLTPSLKARRAIGWACANTWLKIAGIRVNFRGAELLPSEPSVVVANHASYVDGVLMKAALPTRFTFVIKKEMMRVPFAGLLLRRLGAEFVDRFNRQSGAMDARRLMRAASNGTSMVFFPEGTFTGQPGLNRFHGGAFTIASRAGMPVVPVVIRGARDILRGDTIWPRPGRVSVEVLPAIESAQRTVNELRDQSRARILAALGEPDLLQSEATPVPATE